MLHCMKTAVFFRVLIVVLSISGGRTDALDDEWDVVLWDPTGVNGMAWEEQTLTPALPKNATEQIQNDTLSDASVSDVFDDVFQVEHNISDDNVWKPVGNVSLNFTDHNSAMDASIGTFIDFEFENEERDLFYKFGELLDALINPHNNTTDRNWTFISLLTLMPLQCSEVQKIVSLFDRAMRESNPDSEISSVAQRLGSAACGPDGVCPCKDTRRYSQRVMELRSTSKSRTLQPPASFPYPVKIALS